MKMRKQLGVVATAALVTCCLALSSRGQVTNILVHDTWQDATRTDPASPTYAENNGVVGTDADADTDLESAWFFGGAGALTATTGHLTQTGVVASSSSWTTYFTPEATPVNLANVGDQLKLTWQFTPSGVNASNTSQNFRLALVDAPSASRLTADAAPGSAAYSGYGMFMNFGTKLNATSAFQLMGRTAPATSSALLSASGSWTALTNGAGKNVTGYVDGTQYTYVMTLTHNASGGLDITSTMTGGSIGNTGSITDSYTDATPNGSSFTFDTFSLRPSGADTTANIFDTTLLEVDYITTVPEPSAVAMVGTGLALMLGVIRRRRS